jgi:RHS repeat-associated protein
LARADLASFRASSSAAHAFYHADGNGNVTAMESTAGVLVALYAYDRFGNQTLSVGPLASANVYRFSSKEFHPQSGLSYYLRRFYAPSLDRWLNRDPLCDGRGVLLTPVNAVEKMLATAPLEAPQAGSLYGFVYNSPLQWGDSDGLVGWGFSASATVGVGVGPGFSGTAEAGFGAFVGPNENGSVASFGGYTSTGMSLPDSYGNFGFGCSAGGNFFLTNADNANELEKTEQTAFLSIGLGVDLSLSLSWGNGIWQFSVGTGPGGIIDAGVVPTCTKGGTLKTQ